MASGCILVPFVSAGIGRMLLWQTIKLDFAIVGKGFGARGVRAFGSAADLAGLAAES